MPNASSREILVNSLRNLTPEMKEKLDSLRVVGEELLQREDIVWHILLQSLSGMGNNRGYDGLILNRDNYDKVKWETIYNLPEEDRLLHIESVLSDAVVRMPGQKAQWLDINFDRILQMGGIDSARKVMLKLKGRNEKSSFFQQFEGIGDKYGRNIWMDLCDPDFQDAIAIDVRLKKFYAILGISIDDYSYAEKEMLNIAEEANLTGWELDRLLFHFTDYFLAAIDNKGIENIDQMTTTSNDKNESKPVRAGGYGDGRAKRTGEIAKEKAEAFLIEKGFTLQPPAKARSGFDLIASQPDKSKKEAKIQIKGRGQADNPRWFQFTISAKQLREAIENKENLEELWKQRIFAANFWILVAIPKNEIWVLPSAVVLEIADANYAHYKSRPDNQFDNLQYDNSGSIKRKQKELNLDVKNESGLFLWEKYEKYKDKVDALNSFLG